MNSSSIKLTLKFKDSDFEGVSRGIKKNPKTAGLDIYSYLSVYFNDKLQTIGNKSYTNSTYASFFCDELTKVIELENKETVSIDFVENPTRLDISKHGDDFKVDLVTGVNSIISSAIVGKIQLYTEAKEFLENFIRRILEIEPTANKNRQLEPLIKSKEKLDILITQLEKGASK